MWSKSYGASVRAKMFGKFFIFAIIFLMAQHKEAFAYGSLSKENIFTDVLLNELLNRMDKDIDQVNNYFDDGTNTLPKSIGGIDMLTRSSKNSATDDYETYRNMFSGGSGATGGSGSSNPSIRDQEYLQHSSLWGHQYISGGMGEVPNRYNTIIKTDASLPAYCNPPNPCPFGYEESQGCISDFENTAIFSREYQAAQECTCDNEHMFDCAAQENNAANNEMTSTMEKFLMHQFGNENVIDNSNPVVKKFYGFAQNRHEAAAGAGASAGVAAGTGDGVDKIVVGVNGNNPFLEGEKLPIAAKKGDHIHF